MPGVLGSQGSQNKMWAQNAQNAPQNAHNEQRALAQHRMNGILNSGRFYIFHKLPTGFLERTLNLSIMTMSGPGEVPRVESN